MRVLVLGLLALNVLLIGCGGGLDVVPVHGTVNLNGKPIPDGEIRFVPIEDTKGPASVGNIVAGEYKIDARGGVPVGKHRIEIRVIGRTGAGSGAGVMSAEGAVGNVGPPIYDSPKSPLTCEVSPDEDEYNFDIP